MSLYRIHHLSASRHTLTSLDLPWAPFTLPRTLIQPSARSPAMLACCIRSLTGSFDWLGLFVIEPTIKKLLQALPTETNLLAQFTACSTKRLKINAKRKHGRVVQYHDCAWVCGVEERQGVGVWCGWWGSVEKEGVGFGHARPQPSKTTLT